MASLVVFIFIIAMWPFALMWKSYVIVIMWGWFIQPYLGLAAPSIHTTAGVLMILSLATYHFQTESGEQEPAAQIARALVYGFFLPLCALGTAWIWKWLQWGLA